MTKEEILKKVAQQLGVEITTLKIKEYREPEILQTVFNQKTKRYEVASHER